MSATTVVAMATTKIRADFQSCCPDCGTNIPSLKDTQAELLQAQSRVADLESQVRLLNQKATAAVDRWADYEDELMRLRAQLPSSASAAPPSPSRPGTAHAKAQDSPNRTSFLQTGTSRLSALLTSRNKSTPNLAAAASLSSPATPLPLSPGIARPTTSSSSSAETAELLEALTREQGLRKQAEGRLNDTSKEVEELSASLFEQANEMVANERRARAKLEERVDELERRDADKRRRLERLEGAMSRIDRVRNLLENK